MTHPLRAILDDIAAHHTERPVVIFDLDGTLYDNHPRTLRIVRAYAATLGPEHARDAALLRSLTPPDMSYRLDDTLKLRGVAPEVIAGAQALWLRRFFTDTAVSDDVPIRGAVAFVKACHDGGATVVYLTGRDTPGMLVGTVRALRDDGFPIGVTRIELVLKPTFEENDVAFKRRMLEPLSALGRIVATFENEPGNCNLFHARWPDTRTVLIETLYAPGAPALDEGCLRLPDFEHA